MTTTLILDYIEEIETTEDIVELPPFTGDHGDPGFDEELATINEVLASCDLRPVPNE